MLKTKSHKIATKIKDCDMKLEKRRITFRLREDQIDVLDWLKEMKAITTKARFVREAVDTHLEARFGLLLEENAQ